MAVRKIHDEGGIVFSPGIFLSRSLCEGFIPGSCLDGQSAAEEGGGGGGSEKGGRVMNERVYIQRKSSPGRASISRERPGQEN